MRAVRAFCQVLLCARSEPQRRFSPAVTLALLGAQGGLAHPDGFWCFRQELLVCQHQARNERLTPASYPSQQRVQREEGRHGREDVAKRKLLVDETRLHRRVKKDLAGDTDVVHPYNGWQVLEEREWDSDGEGSADDKWEPRRQYAYEALYIDESLIFDKDTDDDGDCVDAGGYHSAARSSSGWRASVGFPRYRTDGARSKNRKPRRHWSIEGRGHLPPQT